MRAMKSADAVGRRFRDKSLDWTGVCTHVDHPCWLPPFIAWFDVVTLEFAGGRIPDRFYLWHELELVEDDE